MEDASAPVLRAASPASVKSSSAFRTIGEVASDLGVSPHVLRFWESKFTQIKPHKRRGGHRYYRPADVEIIREIRSLLYDRGFTIKGAQKYLKDQRKDKPQNTLFELPAESVQEHPASVEKLPANNNKHGIADPDRVKRILNELEEVRALLRTGH